MNPKVDWFFAKDTKWREAFLLLRGIALGTGLSEELKWGHPCYTLNGRNVFLMHGFNGYFAVLFHKGVLLKDPKGLLVQQTPNVQSARQMRFASVEGLERHTPALKAFMREAVALEKAGRKVELKGTAEYAMPAEFKQALKDMPELKKAFASLTPGRQRGYLLHFSSAKQARTRTARIEKHVDRILAGKGLDDR